mmetsp:Transcript_41425/g.130436  ORF Transcript_41425/g.130436 Transcript_41425/m.130436 type:complete len:359 (-) Transcript_41425:41-1117(-)
MAECKRSEIGQKAYWEFIKALEKVDQVEKGWNEVALESCEDEPLVSRYVERLRERAERSADNVILKGLDRPAIRFGTFKYLTSKREEHFDSSATVMSCATLALYAYNIWSQYTGILRITDDNMIKNRWIDINLLDLLWLYFCWKECFLLSVPVSLVIIGVLLAFVTAALSPAVIIAKHMYKNVNWNTILLSHVIPAIQDILYLTAFSVLNLSTSWRMIVIAVQIFQKSVNPSLKDFSVVLTTISNLIFDMVIVMLLEQQDKPSASGQLPSILISMGRLLIVLNSQHMVLDDICDVLRDINENRLNKFELALSLVKLQERLLDDDIQYNFVEHFYTGTNVPFIPDTDNVDRNRLEVKSE